MSGFCIFRAEKHKTVGSVRVALSHDLRARETPNADPKLYENNTYSSTNIDSILAEMNRLVDSCDEKCEEGKAVLCIQYLVTASPEAADDPAFSFDKYLNDGLEALKEKHGAENVIFSAVHRDESTPHMTVYVVPVVDEPTKKVKRSVFTGEKDKDGKRIRETKEFDSKPKRKLSAAHFMDGSAKLSASQTWFHQTVGIKHGLDRGVLGSKARHTRINTYYGVINSEIPKIKIPDIRQINGETIKETECRVRYELAKQINPILDIARSADVFKIQAKEASKTNKKLSEDNQRLRNITEASELGFKAGDLHGDSLKKAARNAELEIKHAQLEGEILNQKNMIQKQRIKYKNETNNLDAEISRKQNELNTINRTIESVKNAVRGFATGLAGALTAMHSRDLGWFKSSLSQVRESARECVKACPELREPILNEARSIDNQIEQPIFEPAIRSEINKMQPR